MIRVFGHEDYDRVCFSSESSALLARWMILEGEFPHWNDSAHLAEQHDRYLKVVKEDENTFILIYDDADPFFDNFIFEIAVNKADFINLLDYLEIRTDDFDARIAERLGIEPPRASKETSEATATGNNTEKKKPRRAQRSARAETVCPA